MFKECRHIMPSGCRCHSPALSDQPYCYFHTRLHRSTAQQDVSGPPSLSLPVLEDSSAVQLALSEVLGALGSSQLESRRAGLLLYGLQIAAHLTGRASTRKPADFVRSVCEDADGPDLAPEKTTCEPPADCFNCPERDGCVNPMRAQDDDHEDQEDKDETEEDE